MRYIAYSVASCEALAQGATIDEARSRALSLDPRATDEFLVVLDAGRPERAAEIMSPLNAHRVAGWLRSCAVVWRGENSLAQRWAL